MLETKINPTHIIHIIEACETFDILIRIELLNMEHISSLELE